VPELPHVATPSPHPAPVTVVGIVGSGWADACLQRSRRWFWLKATGITALLWLFFVGYFHLLRHPAEPPLVMPLTVLDHAIGFQAWAVVPYVSLWLYVGIAPGLLARLAELLAYALWASAMCVVGLACYYFWPSAVPDDLRTVGADGQPLIGLLRGIDAAGNACPSLHVAGALFSALWIGQLLREVRAPAIPRALNAIWALAIVYSTLATKQHVAIDVLAGAALALLFAAPSIALRRRRIDRRATARPTGPR